MPRNPQQLLGLLDEITRAKADTIIGRDKYKVTGLVMTGPTNGDRVIVEKGAVRWLTREEFSKLMHG